MSHRVFFLVSDFVPSSGYMPGPQHVRSAANLEIMTKCNVIATSSCLQSQRQRLSAMPLQPLRFPITVTMNECNVIATCDDSETQRH